MGDSGGLPGLWPMEPPPEADQLSPNVVEARGTGVLPYQRIQAMVRARAIAAVPDEIELDQIQPASLDLRLGLRAYRVRASFLPGRNASVMDRIKELDGLPAIDLRPGAVLERGAVYVVELMESVKLNADTVGIANPKSSTGRLDILTRLITNHGTSFDWIEKGYSGPLFLEVAPLTFSIVVYPGVRLSQVRFHRDRGVVGGTFAQTEMERLYESGQLVRSPDRPLLPLRDGELVPVTVDLRGDRLGDIVGYKAKKYANRIDLTRIGYYDPRDFWEKIESREDGSLTLNESEFYILATREEVGVPRQTAAEMVPYDTRSGEFRVHYAGFFDPGFGWTEGAGAGGSRAVLEVRSYGVSFTLEHGQIIGWLRYARIATGFTEKLYGSGELKSNYQGQGVALAKQFKKWPASA
jgi:dCTP deaminase